MDLLGGPIALGQQNMTVTLLQLDSLFRQNSVGAGIGVVLDQGRRIRWRLRWIIGRGNGNSSEHGARSHDSGNN
ncbi:hypothetical protein [Streptomyces sp. cg40]|uniref:hypothetical protein n=1 Tax=Streptomyces sp. cg40 TaxID=3419764 RepID=UPI003D036E4E